MTGARRGRPEDKLASGRELWTIEGTNTLIRKLQNDPGLTEEARKEFIESVRSGALEKKIGAPEEILQYRPPKKEAQVTQPTPEPKTERAHMPPITKEVRKAALEKGAKDREALLNARTPGHNRPATPAPIPTAPTTPAVEAAASMSAEIGKTFDSYQEFTTETALFPQEVGVPYTALGLNGESAEVAGKLLANLNKTILTYDGMAVDENRDNLYHLNNLLRSLAKTGAEVEKFKKALRKGEKKLPPIKPVSAEEKKELAKEIGDVLWYCAQLSRTLGYKLSDIAAMNVEKLSSRRARGVLHGNGDNR